MDETFTILSSITHTDNLKKDAIIIWLDDTIGTSTDSEWFNVTGQLRQIIHHLEVFTDVNECIEFISSIRIKLIFLVIAGTYGDHLNRNLFQEIINNIFVYAFVSKKFAYNDEKIVDYFDKAEILIHKIRNDYIHCASTTMETDRSTTYFINPLLIKVKCLESGFEILRRISWSRDESMNELISFCSDQYNNSSIELQKIDEFQTTYRSEDAVWWYTRDSFLYRLLNKSFRTNNMDSIMYFSFITTDIYDQLHKLYCNQHVQQTSSFRVYRGQLMNNEEFQKLKLNVGEFISNNTFLSSNKDSQVAAMYGGDGTMEGYVSVIFQISINSNSLASKPFADVSRLSPFIIENEVLFSKDSIFQINSCEQLANNFWTFELILCNNSNLVMQNTFDHFDVAMLQLLEILPQISPNTHKFNDRILQQCRLYHRNNPIELTKIDQLEISYRSDSSVRHYRKDSFLYRLLNIALRHQTIDIIIDFHYFIIDLYSQLTKSHIQYVKNFKTQNLIIYRDQVEKYNLINSFFSTTFLDEIVLIYTEFNESDRKKLFQPILFGTNIDLIKLKLSNIRFRVKSVIYLNTTIWVIHLILTK